MSSIHSLGSFHSAPKGSPWLYIRWTIGVVYVHRNMHTMRMYVLYILMYVCTFDHTAKTSTIPYTYTHTCHACTCKHCHTNSVLVTPTQCTYSIPHPHSTCHAHTIYSIPRPHNVQYATPTRPHNVQYATPTQ